MKFDFKFKLLKNQIRGCNRLKIDQGRRYIQKFGEKLDKMEGIKLGQELGQMP